MRVVAGFALAAALLLAPSGSRARAEDEQPPACDLPALRFEQDARLLQIYDGLRRGLEKANLPRVCLEAVRDDDAWAEAYERRLVARAKVVAEEGGLPYVVFLFGDRGAELFRKRAPTVPRVFILNRYSLRGWPLAPLPEPEGRAAVVYAETRLERVAEILQQMLETDTPTVAMAWTAASDETAARLDDVAEATGVRFVPLDDPRVEAVLHLRFQIGETLLSLRDTVRAARARKVPVVSDDPARYRLGLVPVVLSTHPELVGRFAAEAARVLVQEPDVELAHRPRPVVTTRVLVDLKAADTQGLSLPLEFLAAAFELTRGASRKATGEGE